MVSIKARIIEVVERNPDCTSRFIAETTGIKKEVVWQELKYMVKVKWLNRREDKIVIKGTPYRAYRYTLSDRANLAIQEYGSFRNYEIAKIKKRMEKLL